jgi:hypothetical protein
MAHSSVLPVVALKEWKSKWSSSQLRRESDGRLSSARLPRQGNAPGRTLFHLPSSRPERMEINWLSFFSPPFTLKVDGKGGREGHSNSDSVWHCCDRGLF